MNGLFSIGETAKLNGVTIKALRFYDDAGLLQPQWTNPETGYRYYSIDQFFTIEMITYCKNLGVPIKSMKRLFDKNDSGLFLKFFQAQLEEASRQILCLNKAIIKMKKLEGKISSAMDIQQKGDVYFNDFPERTVLTRKCTTPHDNENTHLAFLDIYKEIMRHNLITIYETGSIVSIDPGSAELTYQRIFTEVSLFDDSNPVPIETLPSGRYLCVNYYIRHREGQIEKLCSYLERNHLSPRLVIETETFADLLGNNDPMMELQALL